MDIQDIVKEIDSIRDDAYWASGSSHQDVLIDSLEEVEQRLAKLLESINND